MAENLPASGQKSDGADRIRLDKWLWHARQAKSRSLAQKMIQAGQVRVNGGRVTNNAQPVGPGDVITLAVHGGTRHADVRLLEIIACGVRRGPYAEAAMLYADRSQGGDDVIKMACGHLVPAAALHAQTGKHRNQRLVLVARGKIDHPGPARLATEIDPETICRLIQFTLVNPAQPGEARHKEA